MPSVNTEAMNLHLKEIGIQVATSAHALLVCDGAGWHQSGERLIVPDNITLMRLPPYAPEHNLMENVWDHLRGDKSSSLVWEGYGAILIACEDAWNFLANDPERIVSPVVVNRVPFKSVWTLRCTSVSLVSSLSE
jgi:hypothetical protein